MNNPAAIFREFILVSLTTLQNTTMFKIDPKLKLKQNRLSVFPLLTKLIVVMLIVLGCILSFIIYQDSKLELQSTLNILEQEGSRLIYQIESYKEVQLLLADKDKDAGLKLQSKLHDLLKKESHLSYIHILNNRGETIIDVGHGSFPKSHSNNSVLFSLTNEQQVTHTYKDPKSGNLIFEIIQPLEPPVMHVKGEIYGVLRLGLLLDKVRTQINKIRRSHLYTLSICVISTLIIGTIFFYFLIASYHYRVTTSALRQAEEKNRIMIEKMKLSERLTTLGEFSAGIAHEIKNPLASIKNFTQLLPSEYEDPRFRKEFVETVTNEVNRINRIVNDLLNYARPRKIKLIKTDIPSLVDEIVYSLSSVLGEQHVTIKKDFCQIPLVEVDPEQIRQVLLNIVMNAVEATPKGGTVEITIRTNENQEAEIEVSDTGRGIPEKILPALFNPFFTTKEGGTGLGLSIALRIVTEHNGRIKAKSKITGGASFTISLPITQRNPG